MTKTKVKNNNENINLVKAILNKLGAALMFPLSFLAFVSLFLGVTFILPSEWLIVEAISSITGVLFGFFPYLAFVSLVVVYHPNKSEYTIIKALIMILSVLAVKITTDELFNVEISFSLFSAMIGAAIFIILDRYNIYLFLWVLIGAGLSLLLVPLYYLLDVIIYGIGNVINLFPFGINAFLYGFFNRLLLPFGLHSIMIPTFAFSPVGGEMTIYNSSNEIVNTVVGDSPIWMTLYTYGAKDFATVGTINYGSEIYTYEIINNNSIGQYQQGFLPIIIFAFPMVALTYCFTNGFDKGKVFLMGTMLTLFSGVTETTEFFFVMINPWLYLVNAVMVGLSFMLCNLLQVHVWLSTGWVFDIMLFGIIPSIKGFHTHWYMIPLIGITIGIIYSSLFILIDKKTNFELIAS